MTTDTHAALRFPARPPNPEPGLCLNRHHRAGCTACVDACPLDAVTLTGRAPVVDAAACVACGVCTAACPADALPTPRPPEDQLLRSVRAADGPVTLTCPFHPDPAGAAGPGPTVVRHGRCLAALSPEWLLALSDGGRRPVWLDDTPCAGCLIATAGRSLGRSADHANALLGAFGLPHVIVCSSRAGHAEPPTRRRSVADGMQPAVTRRGLFGDMLDRLRPTDEAPPTTPGSPRPADRLPAAVPQRRRRLIDELQSLQRHADTVGAVPAPVAPSGDVPLGMVRIDGDRCSGCGLCARFCPTGALEFTTAHEADGTTRFGLTVCPALCLDCGICAAACPDAAVGFAADIPAAALTDLTPRTLLTGRLVSCEWCGNATAARDQPGTLCSFCRDGAGTVRPLHDGAGLMADLLSRQPGATPGGGEKV